MCQSPRTQLTKEPATPHRLIILITGHMIRTGVVAVKVVISTRSVARNNNNIVMLKVGMDRWPEDLVLILHKA
jgi:hypothetical protein